MSTDTCNEKVSCEACEKAGTCSPEQQGAHDRKLIEERMSSVKTYPNQKGGSYEKT